MENAQSQATSLASAEDAVLEKLIEAVSDQISSYCNIAADIGGRRTFALETIEEEILILRRCKAIWLSRSPATVASITIDGVAQDLSDFVIEPFTGAIRCRSGATGVQFEVDEEVVVTYVSGYVTPGQVNGEADPPIVQTLPLDLEAACILGVQQAYAFAAREAFDVESTTEMTEDIGSVTERLVSLAKTQALPKQVTDILDASYKRLSC